jgi:hypothetical protein
MDHGFARGDRLGGLAHGDARDEGELARLQRSGKIEKADA